MRAGRLAAGTAGGFRRVVGWFHISEADVRNPSTHWTYLGICLVLVVLPAFLSNSDPAHISFLGVRVPGSCLSRELFHADCPGCGLTRSFVALTHGRFRESLSLHRLGLVLYLFFLWQIAYRLYCLRQRCANLPAGLLRLQSWLGFGMVAALLANWAVGLFVGGN